MHSDIEAYWQAAAASGRSEDSQAISHKPNKEADVVAYTHKYIISPLESTHQEGEDHN